MGDQVVEEGAAFELMFNVAAAQIERGRYLQASASLEATEKCCRETLAVRNHFHDNNDAIK